MRVIHSRIHGAGRFGLSTVPRAMLRPFLCGRVTAIPESFANPEQGDSNSRTINSGENNRPVLITSKQVPDLTGYKTGRRLAKGAREVFQAPRKVA